MVGVICMILTLHALTLQLPPLADEIDEDAEENSENEPSATPSHDGYKLRLRQTGDIACIMSACSRTHTNSPACVNVARRSTWRRGGGCAPRIATAID